MLSFDSYALLPHFISSSHVASSASVSCICYGSHHVSRVEVHSQLRAEIPAREHLTVLKSWQTELPDMLARLT